MACGKSLRAAPHPPSDPAASINGEGAGGDEKGEGGDEKGGGEDEAVELKRGAMFFQSPVTRPCG